MIARGAIGAAFVADITLKILTRNLPDTVERFSFLTPLGVIGFAPSVNDVLAFSLPIPNAWIWPVGWIVVAVLIGKMLALRRGQMSGACPAEPCWPSEALAKLGRSGVKCQVSGVRIAILAIILGAISNLIDRTFLGGVTDYLSFTNLFPAFNGADLLVLGGIGAWWWNTRHTAWTART